MDTEITTERKTYDDYLNSPDDGLRYEVIDGEFVINPACSLRHQLVLMELVMALFNFCGNDLLGEVMMGPVEIRLEKDLVLQPDLAYRTPGSTSSVLTERGTFGPPDIIFEVVAPWTEQLDYERKRRIYESHSVKEYWIIDPEKTLATVLSLKDGVYEALSWEGDAIPSMALPGFSMSFDHLFVRSAR